MAALVMSLMIFSIAISVYSAASQYQQLQYDQAREVLSNFRVDFGRALVDILAALTQRYNTTAEMDTPRFQAYYQFSFWTRAATRSFASQGIQLSFNTTQSVLLQNSSTFYGFSADPRIASNLTKLFWYTPQAISAVYAGFNANLTALGIYNWTENALYLLNTTLDAGPDFTNQTRGSGSFAATMLNLTVGRENNQGVDNLNASNFQISYFDSRLNAWTPATLVVYNNGGGSYTIAFYTYDGRTIPNPLWKYIMVWVQDTRGIMTESYSYTHIDYTIQENALSSYAAPKPDETYDIEMLANGSLMWYNTILGYGTNLVAPSGITTYVPINITNSQSSVLPTGSQIMLNMNWNTYAAYLDSPVDNYIFFDSTGTPIFSWLENGTADTSTNSVVWLKLNSALAAGSTSTIYVGFYPLGTNVMGVGNYTGENPVLTGTYGVYDNGGSVFTRYWNFSGSTLPTGFAASSSASWIPTGVTSYVPVTLTNAQSTAVAGGAQVLVNVTWSNYAAYVDNPVDNYVFFNGVGTPLFSWLQSGTASNSVGSVWVQLDSGGIPANGADIIYLGFYPLKTNVLGQYNYTGEAPTSTSTYGQYDNGKSVFNMYDNFAGSTLNATLWASQVSGGTVAVNNKVTFTTASGSQYAYIHSASVKTYPLVFETNMTSAPANSLMGFSKALTIADNTRLNYPYASYVLRTSGGNARVVYTSGSSTNGNAGAAFDSTIRAGVYTFAWNTNYQYAADGVASASYADSTIAVGNYYPYLGIPRVAAATLTVQWARLRTFLPAMAMPTVGFGSMVVPGAAAYTVNNGLNLTSGAVYTTSSQFLSLNNVLEANMSWNSAAGFVTGLTQSSASSIQPFNGGMSALVSSDVASTTTIVAYSASGAAASYNLQNGVSTGFTETNGTYYIIGSFVNSSKVGEMHNYVTDSTATGTFNTNQYLWVGNIAGFLAGNTSDTSISVKWIRVRSYNPNGVNPSAAFGSVLNYTPPPTIVPIPLPPVKQFRVNSTINGPSGAQAQTELTTNTVPSQVEVWSADLLTPSVQFANWQLRFNASEKLVFEVNYNASGIHQQTARIYWLSDGDAAIPAPMVNITLNGQFTDISNGVYTLRMVANGGYSVAIDWSMSMYYGNYHVEYTINGIGWVGYGGGTNSSGGTWLPDILPYGAWTIIAGPIRAVAYRTGSGTYQSLAGTNTTTGPWTHNDTVLIPYNTKYWQLYEYVNWTASPYYQDNGYYDFLTMISGTSSSTGISNYAYQQTGGGVTSGAYWSSPTSFHNDANFAYWYSQYQADFGEAVMSSGSYLNTTSGSIMNLFGGSSPAISPWTSSDYDRHVLDSMAYKYTKPATMQIPLNTNNFWKAGVWAFGGFSGSNWTAYAPNIYYKMFIEQYYPTVVAISGGF
ncbi:MAG TPA: hypothetical protein VMS77_09340 [Conexivisphaerales archaeon]|nr:hypothetical protein [Conexivisphaerales archaeon]